MTAIDSSPETIPQACAVPYRRRSGKLEFCLITSLKQQWIFPKGIIDPGETCEQTALKEALEEAGLHGQIVGEPLGSFEDAKWGCRLLVTVLLMEVSRCDQTWQESDVRQRCWASPEHTAKLISKPVLHRFLKQALARILEV